MGHSLEYMVGRLCYKGLDDRGSWSSCNQNNVAPILVWRCNLEIDLTDHLVLHFKSKTYALTPLPGITLGLQNATPPYFPLWCFDLGANSRFLNISRCGVISKMWDMHTNRDMHTNHCEAHQVPLMHLCHCPQKCRDMQFSQACKVYVPTSSFN